MLGLVKKVDVCMSLLSVNVMCKGKKDIEEGKGIILLLDFHGKLDVRIVIKMGKERVQSKVAMRPN